MSNLNDEYIPDDLNQDEDQENADAEDSYNEPIILTTGQQVSQRDLIDLMDRCQTGDEGSRYRKLSPSLAADAIARLYREILGQELVFRALARKSGTWHFWNGRYWQLYPETELIKDLHKLLGHQFDHRMITNIVETMADRQSQPWKRFDAAPIVSFENCVLEVADGKIQKHKNGFCKENFSTYNIPVTFPNSQAAIPHWQEMLNLVLPEKKDQRTLQEMMGYCFFPSVNLQTLFFMPGEAASGKSTILRILREMLGGDDRVSGKSCDDLSERFQLTALFNKYVNIDQETEYIRPKSESVLKKITGGDPLTMEEKGKPHFTAVLPIRIILACNELPRLADKSEGLWSRLVVIPFDHRIPDDIRVDQEMIINRLRPEFSGILFWALKGLGRILKRGTRATAFTQSPRAQEIKGEHRHDSNPVLLWWREFIEIRADATTSKKMAWQHHQRWRHANGYQAMSENVFAKQIKRFLAEAKISPADSRPRNSGISGRDPAWNSIRLND